MNSHGKDTLLAAICSTAFSCAFAFALFFLSMPFVIRALGGEDFAVGMAMAFCYGGYIITCSLGSFFLDRFDEKKLVLWGMGSNAVLSVFIYLIFKSAVEGECIISGGIFSPVILVIGLIAFIGAVQTLIWPPLMGWVSHGYEGPSLTKRLGKYNIGWGSSSVIGPILAGWIVQHDIALALLFTAIFFFISWLIILLFTNSRSEEAIEEKVETNQKGDGVDCLAANNSGADNTEKISNHTNDNNGKLRLLWAVRQSFFIGAAAFILLKTQFALRMVENYGYSEISFGNISMIVALATLVAFISAGKFHGWHDKYWPIVAAIIMQIFGVLIILGSSNFILLSIAVTIIGLGYGFLYSAHQYYGVAGTKKRSASMAIHEITLSVGFAAGSVMGGVTGQHLGRDWPWIFAIGLLVLSVSGVLISAIRAKVSIGKIK